MSAGHGRTDKRLALGPDPGLSAHRQWILVWLNENVGSQNAGDVFIVTPFANQICPLEVRFTKREHYTYDIPILLREKDETILHRAG